MGPRFNGVEDGGQHRERVPAEHGASMGPRFNGVEDIPTTSTTTSTTSSFNGATL